MAGGRQRITTADGYIFPLSIRQGLPYLKMRAYTTDEYNTYPHVIMTSDKEWDPTLFDNEVDPTDPSFIENTPNLLQLLHHEDYDVKGEYMRAHGSSHVATDQEYGERIIGRPPGVNDDHANVEADSNDDEEANVEDDSSDDEDETTEAPVNAILTD